MLYIVASIKVPLQTSNGSEAILTRGTLPNSLVGSVYVPPSTYYTLEPCSRRGDCHVLIEVPPENAFPRVDAVQDEEFAALTAEDLASWVPPDAGVQGG